MEILLSAEKIGHIGTFPVTNTLVASTIVVIFLIIVALLIKKTKYSLHNRFYNAVEMFVEGVATFMESVVGKGSMVKQIFPVVTTFFLFIVLNNWFGLVPGMGSIGFYEPKEHGSAAVEHSIEEEKAITISEEEREKENIVLESHTISDIQPEVQEIIQSHETEKPEEELVFVPLLRSANSDLNMTLAIAIVSVLFIQGIAIKNIGLKQYIGKFLNFSSPFPVMLFVGLLELLSEIIKIFSFSLRLFGNIFAGDVLLMVISGLMPYVAPIPFMCIEMFAGFIQALIFTMLTLVFVNVSVSHGTEH